MPKPSPTRYRTTNWSDYNAALRKRGSLSVWFEPQLTAVFKLTLAPKTEPEGVYTFLRTDAQRDADRNNP